MKKAFIAVAVVGSFALGPRLGFAGNNMSGPRREAAQPLAREQRSTGSWPGAAVRTRARALTRRFRYTGFRNIRNARTQGARLELVADRVQGSMAAVATPLAVAFGITVALVPSPAIVVPVALLGSAAKNIIAGSFTTNNYSNAAKFSKYLSTKERPARNLLRGNLNFQQRVSHALRKTVLRLALRPGEKGRTDRLTLEKYAGFTVTDQTWERGRFGRLRAVGSPEVAAYDGRGKEIPGK